MLNSRALRPLLVALALVLGAVFTVPEVHAADRPGVSDCKRKKSKKRAKRHTRAVKLNKKKNHKTATQIARWWKKGVADKNIAKRAKKARFQLTAEEQKYLSKRFVGQDLLAMLAKNTDKRYLAAAPVKAKKPAVLEDEPLLQDSESEPDNAVAAQPAPAEPRRERRALIHPSDA